MISPKISIITASFNSEKTISETIESILNQSYKNIEYLIIDGGSKDNTVQIIKSYEALFAGRLKWISENDTGIYDAWNKGIELSTGDWISFVGSDDVLLNNAISEYVAALLNNPNINFISSMILHVRNNLTPIRIVGKPWSEKMKIYCCIAHVGSLHHKNLFSVKGHFNTDYKICGDYDFLLRSFDIIKPYYIPIVTAKMREGGISDNQIFRIANETLKTKINNKSRIKFICIIEYYIMILKFFLRKLLNRYFHYYQKKETLGSL